jgi:hypothetical protein
VGNDVGFAAVGNTVNLADGNIDGRNVCLADDFAAGFTNGNKVGFSASEILRAQL